MIKDFVNDRFAEIVHFLRCGLTVAISYTEWKMLIYYPGRTTELAMKVPRCVTQKVGNNQIHLWVE